MLRALNRTATTISALLLMASTTLGGAGIAHAEAARPGGDARMSAAPRAGAELGSLTSGVQRHLVVRGDDLVFDATAARAAGESAQVLEAGLSYNAIVRAGGLEGSSAGETLAAGFPIWGNWCGPGHSGPEAPKDTLDTLCMRHDKCYAARGYFDCLCDAQLKAEIRRFSDRMGFRERAVAAAIVVYFSVTPCKP